MKREIPKGVLDNQDYWDEEFKEKLKAFFGSGGKFRASGRTYILAETLLAIAIEEGGHISYELNEFVGPISSRGHLYRDLINTIHRVIKDYEYTEGISISIESNQRTKYFKVISVISYIGDVHPKVIEKRFFKSREYHLNKNK